MVAVDRLMEIDRYALDRYAEAARKIVAGYAAYDFPAIFQIVNALVTVDLSAFYFDVSKDRLYTWGAASAGRRSAQTALFEMVDGLVRLIAPILPVSADELWRALPGERDDSVHLATFPAGLDAFVDPALAARWEQLLVVREAVLPYIEGMRQQKTVGQSLEAHVMLTASDDLYRLLDAHRDDLPMLFITSTASLVEGAPGGELEIAVARTDGTKCVRCWRYVPAVAAGETLAGLCARCVEAVTPLLGAEAR
jgi:isoleucyl-tRNA synthetase